MIKTLNMSDITLIGHCNCTICFSTDHWSLKFAGTEVTGAAIDDDATCPLDANWLNASTKPGCSK